MSLCFSHLCFLIYFPIFLLALRLIMPYCYLYHYVQFLLNKYYFCKRSVHSFLGLSSNDSPHPLLGSKCGLGLVFSNEYNPNVVGSSSLPLFSTKPVPPLPSSPKKKDPCGMGFVDDTGVMSCTESLGFESCNETRVDDDPCTEFCEEDTREEWRNENRVERKRSEDKKRNKKFPPPLPSLNQNGQPCFYLRPVRQNGRLELTEVWIHRPEVLRAVRENGRLRLHIVNFDDCCKFHEDGEEDEDEAEEIEHEEQEVHDLHEEEEGMKVEEIWKYRVNEEGSRRCQEMVNYHRHHHGINDHHSLHVWRQPCLSIR
ncbi:hypothetical protein V6N11_079539 [Hibiscus sabdariffa]|uniref:FAF domain-containing protein n=1 Tax=Hibiscus sabdariffa TaxID=183260 RepID=A0ABR2RVN6_9ROSI